MSARHRTGAQRAHSHGGFLRAVVCATALTAALGGALGASVPTAAGGVDPLQDEWREWTPGRTGVPARQVTRSARGRLLVRLGATAPRGAVGWYRLRLPASAAGTTFTFRTTIRTPGATAFVAIGGLRRRAWSRSSTRSVTLRGKVGVGRRRTVYVGVARRRAASRPASVVVHSYAFRRGAAGPIAGSAGDPGATRGARPPAPTRAGAGEVSAPLGAQIFWGARVGGNAFGAPYGDAPYDMATLARFEADAGKRVSLLAWGQAWYDGGRPQRFEPSHFERVRRHGAIPVVDWSPWDRAAGGHHEQPDFQLRDVIEGKHDAYIREWATAAAAWGHPFFLRYAHEMNGAWYPWSEWRNGNAAGEFVTAWRHVHSIFQSVGATNVTWVWSPNEISPGWNSIPLRSIYPGDAYVDWLGMTGYNWGNGYWRTFHTTFRWIYPALRELDAAKPIMITEVGASERGGSKPAWVRDMLDVQLPSHYPAVRGLVYWNREEEGLDWPIQTSAATIAAFAAGIGSPYYAPNRFSALPAARISAR